MGKSTFFTGRPIFTQLLSFIPRSMVSRLVHKHRADHYTKKFSAYEHLVTMLYATLNRCNSLREVISGMQACSSRLLHLGIRHTPRRSTLSDANQRRPEAFFEDLYHELYQRHFSGLPDSSSKKKWLNRLYIVDSTTVSLFTEIMKGAGESRSDGRRKGGIKAHVCMRAAHNTATLVRLSEARVNDQKFLQGLQLPPGSIVVFDRGYRNYHKFAEWAAADITWISRIASNAIYEIEKGRAVPAVALEAGVQADYLIRLGNPATTSRYALMNARLVVYKDPQTGKVLQFITNNRCLSATTIAAIYKQRWQIELLFKRIKSAFQLHFFLGDSENAIRLQLWSALIADLMLQVVKSKLHRSKKRSWSDSNLASIVRLHLNTYVNLLAFLTHPEKALITYEDPVPKSQLRLWDRKT